MINKSLRFISSSEQGNEYEYYGIKIRIPTEFIQDALEQDGINIFVMFPKMIDYLIAKKEIFPGDSVRARIERHGLSNKAGTSFQPSEGASVSVSIFKREINEQI